MTVNRREVFIGSSRVCWHQLCPPDRQSPDGLRELEHAPDGCKHFSVRRMPATWEYSKFKNVESAKVEILLPQRGSREDIMNNLVARISRSLFLPALVAATVPARAEPPKLPVPAVDQSEVAQRGYFYAGGKYVGEPGKEIMQGQVYVEVLAPKDVRRPYPLVLIHGAAQTATNWMGTPDGRKGWAEFFVEQGYVVYMIEQPMRGRSA